MKNIRKSKYFNNIIKGLDYKDIALQPLIIPPDASDHLKRVLILLGLLKCGNNNINISEFSALLDKLYIEYKINKL